ncbi:MAG: glycosyltransferase family 4 protein [Verrucomicrobia bacterium]|nr:glycosyltransferase family 4 protein [Verrucomicrobiota bacterium]
MKIALLKSGFFQVGGLEKYTKKLAEAFAKRGCEVTLLTCLRRTQKEAPPVDSSCPYKIVSLGKQSWFGAKNRLDFDRECREWLKVHPQEVVFGMDRNTHQTHYRVGEGIHRAYLEKRRNSEGFFKRLSFKINPLHLVNLYLESKTFSDPHLKTVITNSFMVKEELLACYPVDPTKVHVVHNGVEWQEMEAEFEASLKFPPHPQHHFLFIGNGWRRKGLAPLLEAIATLPKSAFHLTILGKEKKTAPYLEQIKNLELEKNVSIEGLKNARPFLQHADTLVLPSLYDPFANVTVEALAMGLDVITSPYNGGKEVLTPDTGTIVEMDHLAEALHCALSKRKTEASARRQRESVRHLDFSQQLTKIVELTLAS